MALSPSTVLKADVPSSNGLADSSPLNLDLSGVCKSCVSDLTDLGTSNPSIRLFLTVVTLNGTVESLSSWGSSS